MSTRDASAAASVVETEEVYEPRRLRWTVSAADVSTQAWVKAQEDVPASLRVLVRESIEREGYTDVYNRPVDQKPRQGRPPAAPTPAVAPSRDLPIDAAQAQEPEQLDEPDEAQQPAQLEPEAEPAQPRRVSTIKRRASDPQSDDAGSAAGSVPQTVSPTDGDSAEAPVPRQVDMNEIMRSTRR